MTESEWWALDSSARDRIVKDKKKIGSMWMVAAIVIFLGFNFYSLWGHGWANGVSFVGLIPAYVGIDYLTYGDFD